MSIPDSILKQMVIKFKAARVFHPNGCITLNDRMPCIDLDTQRNQIRIDIYKQGREYKISARRLAIYLKTGKLPDQPIFVTCSKFHCINPEHLRLGEYGDRSAVKNHKRDNRRENLNRKLTTGGKSRGSGGRSSGGTFVYSYTEEHHLSCDESEFPLWAQDLENTIDVKATRVD